MRNPDINQAYAFGSSTPVQLGQIANVYGFGTSKYGGALPVEEDVEALQGVVCDPSAIILALGIHSPPSQAHNLVNVQTAVNEQGLVLQFKRWYEPALATSVLTVESLIGVVVGNATGLVQLK